MLMKNPISAAVSPENILRDGKNALGADSCVLYVSDPWYRDSLCLAYMPGVKITEPMHGFMFPALSQERITGAKGEPAFTYFENSKSSAELRDIPVGSRHARKLFGDFVERENVGSCARLRHPTVGTPEVVLWINFRETRCFTSPEKKQMEALLARMVGLLPAIRQELTSHPPFWVAASAHMFEPTVALATVGKPLSFYFEGILNAIAKTFALGDDELGTIHLFNPHDNTLSLEAYKGPIRRRFKKTQRISLEQGIISWVALKRRSILISDLRSSPFRPLYVNVYDRARSEIAIPMLSGEDLLGVVNLESRKVGRFSAESVRALWWAANQAAVACRLVQQVDQNRRLLQVAHDITKELPTVNGARTTREALSKLAHIARDWLGAAQCDIWHFAEASGKFEHSGATYQAKSDEPRCDGWSYFVQREQIPVWISEIQDANKFSVEYWDKPNRRWIRKTNSPTPAEVNRVLTELDVRSEIGLPLLFKEQCVGVAWAKYRNGTRAAPSTDQMQLAEGFSAHAGLVLDLFDRYQERVQQQKELKRYSESLFPQGATGYPGLESYVIRKPYGDLGGDFHAIESLGDGMVGFLIGDGESHGFSGSLHMLPIITTFKVVAKDSESTKHTLLRLLPICEEWQRRSTALYFIIKQSWDKNESWLFASSAGHCQLMIIRPDARVIRFPDCDGIGNRGQMGSIKDMPLNEEAVPLKPGDVVVAYTDGVEDAGKPECLGPTGIMRAVYEQYGNGVKAIAEAIENAAIRKGQGIQQDDLTVLVVKIVPINTGLARAASH